MRYCLCAAALLVSGGCQLLFQPVSGVDQDGARDDAAMDDGGSTPRSCTTILHDSFDTGVDPSTWVSEGDIGADASAGQLVVESTLEVPFSAVSTDSSFPFEGLVMTVGVDSFTTAPGADAKGFASVGIELWGDEDSSHAIFLAGTAALAEASIDGSEDQIGTMNDIGESIDLRIEVGMSSVTYLVDVGDGWVSLGTSRTPLWPTYEATLFAYGDNGGTASLRVAEVQLERCELQ